MPRGKREAGDAAQPQSKSAKISRTKKSSVFSVDLKYQTVGQVFVVGSGDCAQLGLGPDVFEKERPAKLAYFDELQIVAVFAGGLHTLALSQTGKV
jgi:regulator of chromosome condensation